LFYAEIATRSFITLQISAGRKVLWYKENEQSKLKKRNGLLNYYQIINKTIKLCGLKNLLEKISLA
jgi:hypothetical protein